MRRILDQSANSAIKQKDYPEAVWAVAHCPCRVIYKILRAGVRYKERGRT